MENGGVSSESREQKRARRAEENIRLLLQVQAGEAAGKGLASAVAVATLKSRADGRSNPRPGGGNRVGRSDY
jgi:hypothetical protein